MAYFYGIPISGVYRVLPPPPEPKLRGMYYRHQEGCILNVMGVDTPSQVFKPLHNQHSHAILCKGGLLVFDLLWN